MEFNLARWLACWSNKTFVTYNCKHTGGGDGVHHKNSNVKVVRNHAIRANAGVENQFEQFLQSILDRSEM